MGRKNLIRSSEHPYHLSARSNNRDWFDLSLNQCFDVFEEIIPKVCKKHELQVHAFVLMSNHFHLLATTPKANIDKAMHCLMSETSRKLRVKTLRTNHVYGGRYGWSLITSPVYFANCVRYAAQNPVRAKIVQRVEDYPYSTFSLHKNRVTELCVPNETGHSATIPRENTLDWLNETLEQKLIKRFQIGLRKPVFEIGVHRQGRKIPSEMTLG